MRDGLHDSLGNPIPARAAQAMVSAREPLVGGPVPVCATPGCLRDVRANGRCIECLEGPAPEDDEEEAREIGRPYDAGGGS